MDIKHPTIIDKDKVIEIYEAKDGVPIKYVCTTDLSRSDVPTDIFYRDSPHPEFGNRYFGLYYSTDTRLIQKRHLMITNADMVEGFEFGMIKDSDNNWYYSSSHHDCIFIEDKMIDGGRQYIRSTGLDGVFKIVNGEFVNAE
jgi:hypothetical protein